MQKPAFFQAMERMTLPSGVWVDVEPSQSLAQRERSRAFVQIGSRQGKFTKKKVQGSFHESNSDAVSTSKKSLRETHEMQNVRSDKVLR